MFKQLVRGMAVVLTAGLMAVGCGSDDGDTIIIGGGGVLNNNDTISANSIADNNLAADGGGLSHNDADSGRPLIVFCCDSCDSDGVNGADNTAIIMWQTTDSNGFDRVYATYWNGASLSAPTELKATDRDYQKGVNLSSYTIMCLATAGFSTTDATATQEALANNGKWLIVGDYQTFTDDPRNDVTQAVGGVLGPHRAIAYWIFDPALAATGIDTSDQIGGVARTFENGFLQTGLQLETARGGVAVDQTSGNGGGQGGNSVAAPACDVTSYGLASDGFAGQTSFGGSTLPMSGTGTNYNYAAPGASAGLNSASYTTGERVSYVGLFYTQIVGSHADSATNVVSSYTNGVGGTFDLFHGGAQLQAKFQGFNLANLTFGVETNVVPASSRESMATSNTTTRSGVGFYPSFTTYNGFLFFKYADASLNAGTPGGIQADDLNGLSISPSNVAGNHHWAYNRNAGNGGHDGGAMNAQAMYEDVCAVLRIEDGGAAEAVLGTVGSATAGAPYDLTQHTTGTAGRHDVTNPTSSGSTVRGQTVFDTAPNREMMDYSGNGQFIFGDDEGLGDVTVFYTSSDNTRVDATATQNSTTGGPTNSMDEALMAAAFNLDGTVTTSGANANPRVVSQHDNNFEPATGAGTTGADVQALTNEINAGKTSVDSDQTRDRVGEFRAQINRTGEYIAVGYVQNEGTSINFYRALKMVAYQTFRTRYIITSQVTITQSSFDARFAGPVDLSARTDTTTAITPGNSGTSTNGFHPLVMTNSAGSANDYVNWSNQPVNDWMFQDYLGYRCGLQSDTTIMTVLYEQSDSTEDAVYVRAVNIVPDVLSTGGFTTGTPTIEAGTQAEGALLVSARNVPGNANYAQRSNATGWSGSTTPASTLAAPISSFRFIDDDVELGESVQAVDLGANDAGVGGGIIIFYAHTTDNTFSDNDFGDRSIFAARFGDTADAVTDNVDISSGTNADAPLRGLQNATTPSGNDVSLVVDLDSLQPFGTNGGVKNTSMPSGITGSNDSEATVASGGYDHDDFEIVAVASNSSIETQRDYSASAIYLYWIGPAAGNVSGAKGLFTRKFDATIRGNATLAAATPEFGNRFTPTAGTGPGTTDNLLPTRLDHEKGGDVSVAAGLEVCQQGTSVGILFQQDAHVWFQGTADGVTYRTNSGSANPALVDNDTGANVNMWSLECCEDANGDMITGAFWMLKDDIATGGTANLRLRMRFLNGLN